MKEFSFVVAGAPFPFFSRACGAPGAAALLAADAATPISSGTTFVIFILIAAAAAFLHEPVRNPQRGSPLLRRARSGWLLLAGISGNEGNAACVVFYLLAAAWLLAWRCVSILSTIRVHSTADGYTLRLLIPRSSASGSSSSGKH